MSGWRKRTIMEMAREAGIDAWWNSGSDWRETFNEHLKAFEALVRADEREQIITKNAPEIERLNAYIKELESAIRAKENT